jgi:multidrug efflux pump subunit AcrA (membrane-fusion protein)
MKRRTGFVLGAVVLAAVGGAALGLLLTSGKDKTKAATAVSNTVRVSRGNVVQSLTVYGTVAPKQEYAFTFQGDKVSEILGSVGQRVESGQVLIRLDSTREELALLQAQQALQQAKAEGVPATIRAKELALAIAQADYDSTTLRAPFGGVITEITEATGSSATRNLTLVDTTELFMRGTVDQLDAPTVALGQKAQAVIEPLPDKTWPVDLVEIGGLATKAGNSTVVAVTGKLPADPTILIGYTVEMQITITDARNVLRVPIACLVEAPRGWMVMKVANGTPTPTQVTLGAQSNAYAEIASGLEEGDEILASPGSRTAGSTSTTSDRGNGARMFEGGPGLFFGPGAP